MDLADLGLTKDEIADRVVDKVASDFLTSQEEGTEFSHMLMARIQEKLDAGVEAVIEKHVMSDVPARIEDVCLQATNQWGEAKGEPVSFVEYLVQRAERYINETVDFQGKGKTKQSYNWSGTQTRITHLVHQHLHYSIETAMKKALSTANESIAGGIEDAVKIKLAEVVAGIETTVKVKR